MTLSTKTHYVPVQILSYSFILDFVTTQHNVTTVCSLIGLSDLAIYFTIEDRWNYGRFTFILWDYLECVDFHRDSHTLCHSF